MKIDCDKLNMCIVIPGAKYKKSKQRIIAKKSNSEDQMESLKTILKVEKERKKRMKNKWYK